MHYISSTEATTMAANMESTQTVKSTNDVDLTEIMAVSTEDVDVTEIVVNNDVDDDDAEAEMVPTMVPTKAGSSCPSFNFIYFILYTIIMRDRTLSIDK